MSLTRYAQQFPRRHLQSELWICMMLSPHNLASMSVVCGIAMNCLKCCKASRVKCGVLAWPDSEALTRYNFANCPNVCPDVCTDIVDTPAAAYHHVILYQAQKVGSREPSDFKRATLLTITRALVKRCRIGNNKAQVHKSFGRCAVVHMDADHATS